MLKMARSMSVVALLALVTLPSAARAEFGGPFVMPIAPMGVPISHGVGTGFVGPFGAAGSGYGVYDGVPYSYRYRIGRPFAGACGGRLRFAARRCGAWHRHCCHHRWGGFPGGFPGFYPQRSFALNIGIGGFRLSIGSFGAGVI